MADLFVTDLDGTLLNDDHQVDSDSVAIINKLVAEGLWFTIATARSTAAIEPVADLDLRLPVIGLNGALISDLGSGEVLVSHFLATELAQQIITDHLSRGLRPFIFTMDDQGEQHVYHLEPHNPAEEAYVTARVAAGDRRFRRVTDVTDALHENVIMVTALDGHANLAASAARYSAGQDVGQQPCMSYLTMDIYVDGGYRLDIGHRKANKGEAVLFLKKLLNADRAVCFGDNFNDAPMFAAADESYAVANAQLELIAAATGIIGPNTESAVARFLHQRAQAGLIR